MNSVFRVFYAPIRYFHETKKTRYCHKFMTIGPIFGLLCGHFPSTQCPRASLRGHCTSIEVPSTVVRHFAPQGLLFVIPRILSSYAQFGHHTPGSKFKELSNDITRGL